MSDNVRQYLPTEAERKAAARAASMAAYNARRCAHPSCDIHPSFGYAPPFCQRQAWTCREHRAWFEASVQDGVVA